MTVSGTESYVTTYVYDANNRLLTETTVRDGKTEIGEYTYDPNGNQLSKLSGTIAENDGGYSGLGIYGLSEAYENGFTYELDEYDVFNRLIGVQKDGKTAKYAYKANGLRLSKEVDGQKTNHIWDGGNIVLDVGANNDRYIRGINLIKSDSNGFYLYNAHSDVVQLTDAVGAVTKDYHYDAFGVETNKDEADNNPFRYCAEYFDKETDTIYLRARYYSPRLGRFITQDPIRDGLNWYTYCYNNSIYFVDPSGFSGIGLNEVVQTVVNLVLRPSFKSFADFTAAYGRTIQTFASKNGIDNYRLLYGFLYVESQHNGSGFNPDGSLFIRFEHYDFAKNLYPNSEKDREQFKKDYLYFDGNYETEKFRTSLDGPWVYIHDSQENEYAALAWAISLNPEAAYKSISMGVPQIMGSNYSALGYDSAQAMYNDFCTGYPAQLKGFFNFIITKPGLLEALKGTDYGEMVRLYSGSKTYNNNLKTFCKIAGVSVPQ